MRVALVQQHAEPERAENLARGLSAAARAADEGAEVVIFAELAFDRFHPQRPAGAGFRALAEEIPGPTTEAFQRLAEEKGVVFVLNIFEREGDETFDSSPVIDGDGSILGVTRMVHITDYPGFHEKSYYSPGDRGLPVYATRAGRIGVAICYDRHFPEAMRSLALGGAELVAIPQAGALGEWPEGIYEGEVQVAAFQNGYFAALCNRVGAEEELTFAGESFICGPDGAVLARGPRGRDGIVHAELSRDALAGNPARRLFLPDRRPELYGEWFGSDAARATCRHLLATVAYRLRLGLQGAPPDFGDLDPPAGIRSPGAILHHMTGVLRAAIRQWGVDAEREVPRLSWKEEIDRFFETLGDLDRLLLESPPARCSLEVVLQGPMADVLAHVGQINLLRRWGQSPVKGRNYMKAAIRRGDLAAPGSPTSTESPGS